MNSKKVDILFMFWYFPVDNTLSVRLYTSSPTANEILGGP